MFKLSQHNKSVSLKIRSHHARFGRNASIILSRRRFRADCAELALGIPFGAELNPPDYEQEPHASKAHHP